ncbi:hypothetical protein ACQ0QQ_05610 [Lysinibacillus sphaericus]
MKFYVAFIIQMILWSVFYIAEWLSVKDHIEYKWIMFVLFFYVAFIAARKIVQSRRLTLFVTSFSLSCFFGFKILFENLMEFF